MNEHLMNDDVADDPERPFYWDEPFAALAEESATLPGEPPQQGTPRLRCPDCLRPCDACSCETGWPEPEPLEPCEDLGMPWD